MSGATPFRLPTVAALCAVVLITSCTDGSLPTALTTGRSAQISLSPSFPAAVDTPDPQQIDRLIIVGTSVESGDTLAFLDIELDPTEDSWEIELAVELTQEGSTQVILQVELFSAMEIQWSGRSAPVSVSSGAPVALQLQVFRGPLANLLATSVSISGAPVSLDEGQGAQLAASVQVSDPNVLDDVVVYWTSADPTLASVDDAGTVQALLPGAARIVATAGPVADTVVIQVLGIPAAVQLAPPVAALASIDEQVTFQGSVVDARGVALQGYTLLWEVADSTVVAPLGGGTFQALTAGQTTVFATIVEMPAIVGQAVVAVGPEVASLTISSNALAFAALGLQQPLSVSATDANANPVPALDVFWSSSDPAVASVDAAGTVTANGNGSATVTARVSAILPAAANASAPGAAQAPSLAPGMDTLTVSASVDVTQVVSSVVVTPADVMVTQAGETAQFSAEARDSNGNPVAPAVFSWNSTLPAVATVDGSGLATAVAAGITSIEATASGVTGAGTFRVGDILPGFTKVWIGGDPAGPSDWNNASNWAPPGVPTSTDDVGIPSSANDPALSGLVSVRNLLVDVEATLDQNQNFLSVAGDLQAPGAIVDGTLLFGGSGGLFEGNFDAIRTGVYFRTLSGPVVLTGDFLVETLLTLGAETLTVGGDLTTSGASGRIYMNNVAAVVDVEGEMRFAGASHAGYLTQGTLRVAGDFVTVATNSTQSFYGTVSHEVVFDGAGVQTLTFSDPVQRFQNVTFSNTGGGVTATTDFQAVGLMDVSPLATVDATALTVSVAGGLVDPGAGLTTQTLRLVGSPSVLPATIANDVLVDASVNLPNDVTIVGALTVQAQLFFGGRTLVVSQDVDVIGPSARLYMNNAADLLDVAGDLTFDGATSSGYLTNGVIRLAGNLTSLTTNHPLSFVSSSAHTVELDGTAAQTVNLANVGTGAQRFLNVTFSNTSATVTMASDLIVAGALTVPSGATVDASGRVVRVAGSYSDPSNGLVVPTLRLYGNPSVLPATLTTELFIDASITLPNDVGLTGNLSVLAQLFLSDRSLAVSGNVDVTGPSARLYMNNAAALLDIEGDLTVDGATSNGYLTNGLIRVAGNLTSLTTSDPLSFVSSSVHSMELDGTAAQTVNLANVGIGAQRFLNVTFSNTAATVTMASDLVVAGALTVPSGATVDASGRVVRVAGGYSDPSNGLVVPTLRLYGNPSVLPATLTTELFIDSNLTLPNNLALTGNLTTAAQLFFSDRTLSVSGNVDVTGPSARLYMNNAAALLDVEGDLTIDGATTNGYLTNGLIRLAGNLASLTTNDPLSFVGSSVHTVEFDGTAAQTVNLANVGTGAQRFLNVTFSNLSVPGVTMASDLVVAGMLTVPSGATVDASGRVARVAGGYTDPSNGLTVPTLRLYGNPSILPATLNTELFIDANFTVPNDVALTGNLTASAQIFFSDRTLAVTGNVDVIGPGARLYMNNAAALFDVEGDLTIDGTTTSGYLTNGLLRLAGDFTTQTTNDPLSFVGSVSHTVELDGAAPQTVTMANTGTGAQRFQNVTFSNPTGVTMASNLVAGGLVTVVDGATVDASAQILYVAGGFADPGIGMTVPTTRLYGSPSVLPAALTTDLFVDASMTVPNAVALTGNLTVQNQLFFSDRSLAVSGNVDVTGGAARLYMNNAGALLDIGGSLTVDGATTSGWLTNGTIQLEGDFTAASTFSTTSFVGSGSHTVEFDGSGAQSVTFSDPGTAGQRFQNVRFLNLFGTVSILSELVAAGTLEVDSDGSADASGQTVRIAGSYADPNASLTVDVLRFYGNLTEVPTFLSTELHIDALMALPGFLSLSGDLYVNHRLQLAGNQLNVSGNVTVSGSNARVYMNNANDIFDIDGDVLFDGADESGWLTNGRMNVAGNFTASNTVSPNSFAATSVFEVVLDGAAPRTVSLSNPGVSNQRFWDLSITTTADVTFTDDVVVLGTLTSGGVTLIQSGGAVMDVRRAINIDGTTFSGMPLRLETTFGAASHTLDNVTFQSMDPTVTQWFVRMPGPTNFFTNGMTFSTQPTLGVGYYIDAGSSNGGAFTIFMQNSSPVDGSIYQLTDGVVVIGWGP